MADVGAALATMLGGNYVNLFSLYGRSYQVIPQAPREFRLTPDWLTRYQVRAAMANSCRCRRWRPSPRRCSRTR